VHMNKETKKSVAAGPLLFGSKDQGQGPSGVHRTLGLVEKGACCIAEHLFVGTPVVPEGGPVVRRGVRQCRHQYYWTSSSLSFFDGVYSKY
jgi:hypothetical protein